MLLSSALSSKAIEETGGPQASCCSSIRSTVRPRVRAPQHRRRRSAARQRRRIVLRNVTDLRRASEEIEENYRKMRIAAVWARAEATVGSHHRLGLDRSWLRICGAASLMNEPAERCSRPPAARSSSAGSGERCAFLLVHRRHAGQRRSAASARLACWTRRPRADAGRGDRGEILSEHGELTAVVTILRPQAIEKAAAAEQLKEASDESNERFRRLLPISRNRTSCCGGR